MRHVSEYQLFQSACQAHHPMDYILLEHLLYITWAFIIYYLGIYYILLGHLLYTTLTLTDFTGSSVI